MSGPIARLFDAVSRVYDTDPVQAAIYRPAQDLVIGRLREARVRRVLDVGCGTGILADRMTRELGIDVIGCDFSAGMLEQALTRNADVAWIRGDAMRLPVADASVDAVTSTEAFHFFDQPAALAEFARVLAPGGLLFIAMINPRTDLLSALLARQLLGAGTWPTRRRMHGLVQGAGFTVRAQQRVNRLLGRALPTVLTVATRSSEATVT
jgi:ubiquinone/menaquinone biosynthesis C-methylase UbiE